MYLLQNSPLIAGLLFSFHWCNLRCGGREIIREDLINNPVITRDSSHSPDSAEPGLQNMHAAAVSKLGAARLSFLDSHRPRFNALTLRPWLRFTPRVGLVSDKQPIRDGVWSVWPIRGQGWVHNQIIRQTRAETSLSSECSGRPRLGSDFIFADRRVEGRHGWEDCELGR